MRNPETASIIERLIACRDTLKVVEGQFAVNLQPERAVMADAANALDAYDKTMQRIAEAPSPTPPAGDGWEPIETAPKDGRELIGHRSDQGQFVFRWAWAEEFVPKDLNGDPTEHYDEDFAWWWHDRWGWMEGEETPTHWRPLPTPPAKGEKL